MSALTNVNDFSIMLLVTTFIKLLGSLTDSVDSPASLSSLSESMFQKYFKVFTITSDFSGKVVGGISFFLVNKKDR